MNKENCKDSYNNFKRARYFHGMLMTDRDFTEEQKYHIEKRKLHNRLVHGWGVVCGLKITALNPAGNSVNIEEGLALDCNGNEIYVDQPIEFDVIKAIKGFDSTRSVKQDCEYLNERPTGDTNTYYLVIKYKEQPSDAVPVYAPGSGCEEKVCEYSRIREGFCIDLIKEKCSPPKTRNLCREAKLSKEVDDPSFYCMNLIKKCPEVCCNDQYIYLGSITVIDPGKPIEDKMINNCDCRRFVMTFGLLQHWATLFASTKINVGKIAEPAFIMDENDKAAFLSEVFMKYCSQMKDQPEIQKDFSEEIKQRKREKAK
ncbi:MAG: hypothetical protein WA144_08910 [Candidatus Methanoperedens sp.]